MPPKSSPLTWWAVALAVSLACSVGSAQSFSEELNPTGSPIGGGPGYAAVVTPGEASVTVATRAELVAALATAQAGDVVYVQDDAEIDLTGERDLAVPGGVTLASGRGRDGSAGALLTYGDAFPNGELSGLFTTGGPDVRVTGLRLRGPTSDIGDHDYDAVGVAHGIHAAHPGIEVDNCELYAWGKWAVWLQQPDRAHVHHNWIHHNRRDGFGYGVWVGHMGGQTGAQTLIEANRFNFNRHSVASSGTDNSWETRHNVFLGNSLNHEVDRHTHGTTRAGGRFTVLERNLFLGRRAAHFMLAIPVEGGSISVAHNWFVRDDLGSFGAIKIDGVNVPADEVTEPNVTVAPNQYGAAGVDLPSVQLAASVVEGYAPLTVQLDASAPGAVAYEWHFGDGDDYGDGLDARGPSAAHVFERPGVYTVTARAFDALGVPGTATQRVTVLPPEGGRWLSAWVRDTYVGDAHPGLFETQVLADGVVVWRDDVAGDEGWQHVVADLAGLGAGGEVEVEVRIAVTGAATGEDIVEVAVYADDVSVLAGQVEVDDMEGGTLWAQTQEGGVDWNYGYVSAATRSGGHAARRKTRLGQPAEPGQAGGFRRAFSLVGEVAPNEEEEEGEEETEQVVALRAGWNLVALRVRPSDAALESVLAAAGDAVTAVQDADEQSLLGLPGAVWDPRLAYLVRASEAVSFAVSGVPIEPSEEPMELREGWNFVPYYGQAPRPVAEAFAPLADALAIVQEVPVDDAPPRTYAPGYGVAELAELSPGRGYRVLVTEAVDFVYPE